MESRKKRSRAAKKGWARRKARLKRGHRKSPRKLVRHTRKGTHTFTPSGRKSASRGRRKARARKARKSRGRKGARKSRRRSSSTSLSRAKKAYGGTMARRKRSLARYGHPYGNKPPAPGMKLFSYGWDYPES